MRSSIIIGSLMAILLGFPSAGARLEAEDSLTGHWKAEFQKEDVTRDYFLAIVQEGGELKGSLISARTRAYPFTSASVDGKKISIDIERRYKSEDVVFKIRGEIQADGQIHGTLDIGGERVATVKMWRAPDPVGTWKVKSRSLDSDKLYDSRLDIGRTSHGYTAKFTHEGKELEVRETGWREGHMVLALEFTTDDGEDVPVVMLANFVEADRIEGEWGIRETDRRSVWSATRVKPVAPSKVAEKSEKKEPEKSQPRPVSFAGEWRAEATIGDETAKFTLKLAGENGARALSGGIAGTAPNGADFRAKLPNVKVDGRKISFSWEFERDGDVARIDMEAEFATDGTLKGRWTVGDNDGLWKAQKVLRL